MNVSEDFTQVGLAGPLSPERLAAFETSLGASFPDGYRQFLLAMNGGVPTRTKLTFLNEVDDERQDTEFECYFSLNDGAYPDTWKWRLHESIDRLFTHVMQPSFPERRLVPIGRDVAGNLVCISLEEDRGVIYLYDHDYHEFYRVADSFEAFHQALEPLATTDSE